MSTGKPAGKENLPLFPPGPNTWSSMCTSVSFLKSLEFKVCLKTRAYASAYSNLDTSYESIKNNSLKTPSESPIHFKKGLGIRAHNKGAMADAHTEEQTGRRTGQVF